MGKRALITGITGQDGAYLAKLLIEKGYEVYGTFRRVSTPNFWRLQYLGIVDKVNFIPCEMTDMSSMVAALKIAEPDEVYHLAAMSFVGASFENPIATLEINTIGTAIVLEAVRQICPDAKVYIAATSEMYGATGYEVKRPLKEEDFFKPLSPYAVSKLAAYWLGRIYREAYDMYVVNGILFNHESPLRGLEFVTRKISNEVAKISLGLSKELRLGNIEAKRDWGYAPEYVYGMWLMLQQKEPDDFILATGEAHSVKEFVIRAFEVVGIDDWEKYVVIDKKLFRPLDVPCLIGDYSKAKKKLGWKPQVKFNELVKIMVEEDLKRWERWLNGERFPWDAPLYPSEMKIISKVIRA
ncbi:MAG: GDP-mannose 4,6-dehydratase [Thermoprotei archaeon]|nr:MAG: GDP-mannose 4,6-dehydratase [Thermoprotei archaeon]